LDYGDGKIIIRTGKEAVKVSKSKPMEQQIVAPSAVFIPHSLLPDSGIWLFALPYNSSAQQSFQ
jgi:hypothetical protein